MAWNKFIPSSEVRDKVTKTTVDFAEEFGKYLAESDYDGRRPLNNQMTTSQLRKFFGEVKRQQMSGYNETDFVLLKPKLAYAVGRVDKRNPKIKDFYNVMAKAIDQVENEDHFKNFIKIFEAIVAYHKAAGGKE